MSNNMKLWDAVCNTDPTHTKEVSYGRKFTAIDAQYQIKNATEQFGVYGEKWGIETTDYSYREFPNNRVLLVCNAVFKHPTGSFPISSSIMLSDTDKNGKVRIDEEAFKKVETDITTKALSKLGFNADVFMGLYDDNKYVNSMREKFKDTDTQKPVQELSEVTIEHLRNTLDKLCDHDHITASELDGVRKFLDTNPSIDKLQSGINRLKNKLSEREVKNA